MRYLLSLMVLFLFNTGQSQILLLMEDGIAGADTIPSQFTFADVTDAAVSSYNQGYIVVAGCDSARFYTNGTDSLKLGALGTYDVSPIWADLGDSVYTGLVASDTNETATHSIIYSSNGTPYDTFSVTTVAGGATERVAGDSVLFVYTDLTDGTVTTGEWADQIHGRTFTVTGSPVKGATGITMDGASGFYNDLPDYVLPASLTIETVITIDTTALAGWMFIAAAKHSTNYLSIFFVSGRLSVNYNGTVLGSYFTSSLHNTETHIAVSCNGTIDSVWFNGVPQTTTTATSGNAGDQDYLIFGQYDAGGDDLPNGTVLGLYAINPKFYTDAEAEQNYTWWTEQ